MKKLVLSSIVALLSLSCSLSAPNNSTQEGRMQYTPTDHYSLNFAELEKEYKSFSTKALSDAYVKRMFGKYLSPVNTTQLTRQLEFSRYLKSQNDTDYETSLKNMFLQTPALYDQMTNITAIKDKITGESATFGSFVNALSPYPGVPLSLNATNITAASFTATWSSVSAATYEVVVDNNSPVTSATNSYPVSALTGITHTFKVRAIKNAITGSYSSTYNVTLLPSTLPSDVIAVNVNATGLNNGTNWTNAYTSLQSALTSSVSGKEIWVATGTYKPTLPAGRAATFQLKSGVKIYGGFTGNEVTLSQRNFNTNVVILSGDINNDDSDVKPTDSTLLKTDNSWHVVTGANNSILDGVTVKFGYANGTSTDNSGGGIHNATSSPTVTNVTFSNNYAVNGGGMYNYLTSSPTVTNVTFSNNTAGNAGGGIFNQYSSEPTVTNSTFSNNSAYNGGGIANFNTQVTVTNVTFSNNTATLNGGGLYNNDLSLAIVKNSIFWISSIFSNGSLYIEYSDVQGGFSAIIGSGLKQNLSGVGITDSTSYTAAHNISADPLFVNTSDLDGTDNILRTSDDGLGLQSGSPSRNTGTNTGAPATDIIGTSRPLGPVGNVKTDMGAYEFVE